MDKFIGSFRGKRKRNILQKLISNHQDIPSEPKQEGSPFNKVM